VVEFANRRFLVSVSRGRIELIAEAPIGAAFALPDED
jgi:flagellar protein FliO/FliZ